MIFSAVFFLSFSALAFEILLARIFSISQWNHLSFMVISIALFGFAAGGVLFSLLDARMAGWEKKWSARAPLSRLLFAFTLTALFSLLLLSRLPFDYFRLPFEPVQALYLLGLYLVLGTVFFFAGLGVMIGYAAAPGKSGAVYFANMAGSACGAAAAIPLIAGFGETGAAALSALIPLVPATAVFLFASPQPLKGGPGGRPAKILARGRLPAACLLVLGAVLLFFGTRAPFQIRPSPYKALSQTLRFPDSRVFSKTTSIYGRVDCVSSPHHRYARGLSLKFASPLPAQWVAFRDGDHPLSFYDTGADPAFARHTLQYAGYTLVPAPERVLVISAGGGTAIPCARASGAARVTAAEPHPVVAQWIRRHYGIPVIADTPRAYLSAPGPAFDVIHVEDWGPSLPGTAALTQDYRLTADAFAAYLNRLSDRGVLIVSRRLRLPPADVLRLWATAYAGLVRQRAADPGRHICILRNWDAFVLLVSRSPLPDPAPLIEFAHRLNFDFVYSKPSVKDPVNRYSRFPKPYYHDLLHDLARAHRAGQSKAFFDGYFIDIEPRTDDRPFPNRFIKYDRLYTLYQSTGKRFYGLFMSGEIIVAVVLLEAALISLVFLVLPAFSLVLRRPRMPLRHVLYFLLVGAGFMFLEMVFIQAAVLPLGDPVVSFVAGVTGILLFSAAGGWISRKRGSGAMKKSLLVLALIGAAGFGFLNGWIHEGLPLSRTHRIVMMIALLLPIGLPAGFPFPLGMRILLTAPRQRAFAWAANGCASVVTAVVAVQVAISLGISANLLFAAAAYLAAWLCVRKSTA